MMLAHNVTLRLGLLMILIWVGSARATVINHPVSIRSSTILAPFEPGQTQRLELEMAVERSHFVDKIKLSGSSWVVSPAKVTPSKALAEADVFRLEFELSSSDPSQPLILSYDLDGQQVQRKINLSTEKLSGQQKRTVLKVSKESNLLHPSVKQSSGPLPEPLPLNPKFLLDPDESGPAPDGSVLTRTKAARTIVVSGSFAYMREGLEVPAYGATVFVMADTWGPDTLMGGGMVEPDGSFSVNALWWYDPFKPNIYVMFAAGNGVASTIQDEIIDPDGYSWRSNTHTEVSGSELDIGGRYADSWDTPALHMMGSVVRAWSWFVRTGNYQNIPHVEIRWPTDEDTSHYSGDVWDDEGEIYITDDRTWNEGTHIHEYGHHYVHTYAVAIEPDYCNDFCDAGGCPHKRWCPENANVGFSEGFPNWLADVVYRDWVRVYGFEPLTRRDHELIGTCMGCGPTFHSDPWITEGFFAALLTDLDDGTNEDDTYSSGFRDRLTIDPWDILEVVDFYGPVSAGQFISDFRGLHPDLRYEFWETCANNGFTGIDSQGPDTETLFSTDHPEGVVSKDNTVLLEWLPPYDNFSGVDGYSYTVTQDAPADPNVWVRLSGSRTFLAKTLDPGTWYFAVRAVDREGNWDPGYETYGPITILEPDPGDLRPEGRSAGWDLPLVPKDTQDATSSSVPVDTAPLFSNTYWNASLTNYGEVTTPAANARILLDGEQITFFGVDPLEGGGSYEWRINQGPINVAGGRHTFEIFVDGSEVVAEPDESDNRYGHQWVWNPEYLTPGIVNSLNRPPQRDGGYESVTDQLRWYNSSGVHLPTLAGGVPSPWALVATHTVSNGEDVDILLHDAPTGAEAGFDFPLCSSGRPNGYMDAVIVNAANRPATSYSAGVLNMSPYGTGGNFLAQIEYGSPLTLDAPFAGTLASDEGIALFTFDITTPGPISIALQLDIINDAPPVYAAWFDQSFRYGELLDYDAVAVTDFRGALRLDIDPPVGTHGLVLWRDPIESGFGQRPYTLTVGDTAPDLAFHQPVGWDAPVIPAAGRVVTPTSGPEPANLRGETTTSYLNLAVQNLSPTASPPYNLVCHVDGVPIQQTSMGPLAAWDSVTVIPSTPVAVRGGRHLVALVADNQRIVVELDEDNNSWASQYVWRPLTVAIDAVVTRSAPPDRTADWDRVKTLEPLWFNCDGISTPTFSPVGDTGRWGAVAAMPGSDTDIDLRLHERHTSARDGFGDPLIESAWISGESEFVLMNFHNTAPRTFDAGVLLGEWSKNQDYSITIKQSTFAGTDPSGVIGSYFLAPDQILDLYEFNFTIPGHYRATIDIAEPSLNLGISLYGPDQEYHAKADVAGPNSAAWLQPAGSSESFGFEIKAGETGYYCLAVWKVGALAGSSYGSYTLRIEEDLQLPDVKVFQPSGWGAPLVPRPSADATPTSAPIPTSIAGDMAVTYFNVAHISKPNGNDPGLFELRVQMDGKDIATHIFPGGTAGDAHTVLGTTPVPVAAGRHSLAYLLDYGEDLPELDETNNVYGIQYVWTPMLLLLDTPVYRAQPEPATAGWENLTEGTQAWENVDGVRTQVYRPETTGNFFGCVAIAGRDTTDVDLRIYSPSLGFTSGFDDPLISSNWPPGHTDFALMNFNVIPQRQLDAGIVSNNSGQDDVMVVISESIYAGRNQVGGIASSWMESDALVKVYEIEYTIPGRRYRVDLNSNFDLADLGLSLYGPGASYYGKGDVYDDIVTGPAISYSAPAMGTESLAFTVDTPGWFAIAVWKVSAADRSDSTTFTVHITEVQAVGVQDEGPVVRTQLVGAYPNPFNPMTSVAFDLDAHQSVKLEIFDVRGRLVDVLVDEPLAAGRHERVWRGLDSSGKGVASGVYMIRMTAGETVDLKRISLIK